MRAEVVRLASGSPAAQGLHSTHWTGENLAREAVELGLVPELSPQSVRRILAEVSLKPHQSRFWKTTPR